MLDRLSISQYINYEWSRVRIREVEDFLSKKTLIVDIAKRCFMGVYNTDDIDSLIRLVGENPKFLDDFLNEFNAIYRSVGGGRKLSLRFLELIAERKKEVANKICYNILQTIKGEKLGYKNMWRLWESFSIKTNS